MLSYCVKGYVTVRQSEVLRKEYNTILSEGPPAKKRSPAPMPGDPEEILHSVAPPNALGILDQTLSPEAIDPGLAEQSIDSAHIATLEAVTPLLPMPSNRSVKALLGSLNDLPIFDLPKSEDMTFLQLRTVADACWCVFGLWGRARLMRLLGLKTVHLIVRGRAGKEGKMRLFGLSNSLLGTSISCCEVTSSQHRILVQLPTEGAKS